MLDFQRIIVALQSSWSVETSVCDTELSMDNLARGQCVVSSLIIQDYFGGDLFRVRVIGDVIDEKHYYNILDDGTAIDTTRQQYADKIVSLTPAPIDLKNKKNNPQSIREWLLNDGDTRQRYDLLASSVAARLRKDGGR